MALNYFDILQDWMAFAALALGTVSMLAALVYALGSALMNEKMKTWAKMELMEIFYSAIIFSLALSFIPIIDGAVQGAYGISNVGGGEGGICGSTATSTYVAVMQGGTKTYACMDICGEQIAADPDSVYNGIPSCHVRMGVWYLREIFDETKMFAFDVYLEYMEKMLLQELTINIEFIYEVAGFFNFTPWRGFFTMGNNIRAQLFDWSVKLMMITKFQEVLLRFIATALFPSLFAIGVILRSFTFTRRLGGLILATALSLYFIFPSFYSFGALVMLDIKKAAIDNQAANPMGLKDPPIANTMVFLPGKEATYTAIDGRQYTSADAHGELDAFGQSSFIDESRDSQFLESFATDDAYSHTDFSGDAPADEDERKAALSTAYQTVNQWMSTQAKTGKLDLYVNRTWLPNGPLDVLARLSFWSLFFSLFGVLSTIAAIRSLSVTFGGDIEIAGLTRLI